MNIEKFTTKSREALFAAKQLAESADHLGLHPLHLDCPKEDSCGWFP